MIKFKQDFLADRELEDGTNEYHLYKKGDTEEGDIEEGVKFDGKHFVIDPTTHFIWNDEFCFTVPKEIIQPLER